MTGANDFESTVSSLIESSVSSQIIEYLGGNGSYPSVYNLPEKQNPAIPVSAADDVTGISDGLGDKYDYSQEEQTVEEPTEVDGGKPVKSMNDLIPSQGGLTEDSIVSDLEVEDPDHEAAVDAQNTAPQKVLNLSPPEDLFSDLAGLPRIEPTPQANKKRRQYRSSKTKKAKVSPMTQ